MNMDNLRVKHFLDEYSQITKSLFKSYIKEKTREAAKVGDIPVHLLEKFAAIAERGKKIRGALVVLGYKLAGGEDMPVIYDTSLFIEILHAGVLVHDDIMDQGDFRRGLPTLHKYFETYGEETGRSLATCGGDLAFYLSWDKLLKSNFSKDKLINAGKIYAKYACNVIYGQTLDLVNTFESDIDQKDILNVFRYKTAEYTGFLPLLIGATLAGMTDKKKLAALEEYGLDLGWAFQIQDDILGLYGSEEKTGKPVGSDLREGKMTLLVYYVIKNGDSSQRNYLKTILGNKNLKHADVIHAQDFFKKIGAYEYVVNLGSMYVNKGKKSIPILTDDKEVADTLESLIIFVMNRIV
ncbi:hypothetical protein A2866_03075 [Candidatus Roizmanbacteria bacterium RIFCSPHIGHO2_01_FULL_39_8]|uniref:Polyprenyl synthetase n=3 Tax=Candidatus Roizmaniibacteriota TaxID=1752723 RepID=A0A1F7GGT6_9BACT|nr:MAG: hypothetical protein A2866_03075 [Candidatus Roizmanbacteria bacterium RIFCSPHIGHO2_01_FULL_39_8]OGK26764.1 MAG: hypothetical protein A3C28_01825 [Candidatus Roizmanbacteria bacterium RIFCSPHIGHO2_02_FULL_39_9]OGK34864.1 MAG: hypothetical protein A3F60_05150 [Candidatus Roizmanbacteria bacterium RIFCSPHIGHO2_12_FULL_39_8]